MCHTPGSMQKKSFLTELGILKIAMSSLVFTTMFCRGGYCQLLTSEVGAQELLCPQKKPTEVKLELKGQYKGNLKRQRMWCGVDPLPEEGTMVKIQWKVQDHQTPIFEKISWETYATSQDLNMSLFNKTVFCVAQFSLSADGPWCHEIASNSLLFMVEPPTESRFIMSEDDVDGLSLTWQFSNWPSMFCIPAADSDTCFVTFKVSIIPQARSEKCNGTQVEVPQVLLVGNSCNRNITDAHVKDGYTLRFVANADGKIDHDKMVEVKLVLLLSGKSETEHKLPSVYITVRNTDTGKNLCHSHTDPHYLSVYGLYYNNHEIYEFIVFKLKGIPIEVHTKQVRCTPWVACNEAVSIRVGNDVIIFSNGLKENKILLNGGFCNGTIIQQQQTTFKVFLPTGTDITLTPYSNRYISLDIHFSSTDLKRHDGGLCFLKGNDGVYPWRTYSKTQFKKLPEDAEDFNPDELCHCQSANEKFAKGHGFYPCIDPSLAKDVTEMLIKSSSQN